jgi:hypothetical protein
VLTWRDKPLAAPMVLGDCRTVQLCSPLFRLLTLTRSDFHACWTSTSVTELNRRMRTRMYGGVAGESR